MKREKRKKQTRKNQIRKSQILKLSVCAMLVGISVAIGYFCRVYLTFGAFVRVTFENLPIILSGVLFGPLYGLVVGTCTDLISSLASAQPINPIITVGAACVGLVSGTVTVFLKKIKVKRFVKRILPCVLAHIVGCIVIKTVGLKLYYFPEASFWYLFGIRLLVYSIICVLECVIISALMKNKYIKDFSDYEL